jgi:hypothetical protein
MTTVISSQSQYILAAFNIDDSTGGAPAVWSIAPSGGVGFAMVADTTNGNFIIGGNFGYAWDSGTSSLVSRKGIAVFDTATGALQSTSSDYDLVIASGEVVRALMIDPVGSAALPTGLWIGGHYTGGNPLMPILGNANDLGIYNLP